MPLFQSRLFFRIIYKNREIYVLKIITLAVAFACSTLIILFPLTNSGRSPYTKICGASVFHITRLLAREFTHQLLMAVLIFGPFTYIILKELLRNFVYATDFTWSDPLYPLVYCVLVIVLLCSFQAMSLNRTDLSAALKE